MHFIGRVDETHELERLYKSKESKLVVIYGRRRVGKSTLVEKFISTKKHIRLEGLEKLQTKKQLSQCTLELSKQLHDPILLSVNLETWDPLFDYLTTYFNKTQEKYVVFLDEFQWLAANQHKLVSLIKKYWDQFWSKQNIMLILCGSVSSYMVKRVINSKALYGRINWELCLQQLDPIESFHLLCSKRGIDEVFQYLMLLGGIPKYLQEINPNASLEQNINKLFFTQQGLMVNEYDKIFYSQFKEYRTYEMIVMYLSDSPHSLDEIAVKIKMSSGGGLKYYLDNLEKALFITSYVPYDKPENSKLKKYKLTDEYLRFYFKYVKPNLKLIKANRKRNLFLQLVKPVWNPWLGFAFENFCQKNALYIAEKLDFADYVINWGPAFSKIDTKFQVDLIFVRSDKVITLCELKYYQQPIDTKIIPEVERKCQLVHVPKGYTLEKALISRYGPTEALINSGYFHHFLAVEDFFNSY